MEPDVQKTLTELNDALEVARSAQRGSGAAIVEAQAALDRARAQVDLGLTATDKVNALAATLMHQVSGLVQPTADPHAMPTAPLAGWKPRLAEDFAAPIARGAAAKVLGAKGWAFYDGTVAALRDTSKRGTYDTALSVLGEDGKLRVKWGHKGSVAPYTPYGAALLPLGWRGQLYGRFAARFRTDKVDGRKIAWLLWPDSNVWNEGEIDFPEGAAGGTILGFNHKLGQADLNHVAMNTNTGVSMLDWHTAVIEWRPERLTFILDGKVVNETTDRTAIPRVPMRWVLQHESNLDNLPMPTTANGIGFAELQWVTVHEMVAT